QDKTGGKSDFHYPQKTNLKCAVIVCSDSVSSGAKQDTAGKAIVEKLKAYQVETAGYDVVPDRIDAIRNKTIALSEQQFDLIIFTGGTGLSPTDVTPEALLPLIDKPIPGLMEAARKYGQERTPYAMLSRGVSGYIGNTLVIALPGSAKGVSESMDALFPAILHVFAVKEGKQHE
ncbi:MAG: bifunctional molybdenum cofactor biosynthesis protein MoaC/MoaB, partial [Chitinophagaceae bacterium]|nr:bifunctional molybdenum cofactor biosynthesis protein MoaC/MoaB [Chitinophagaceae bacterium]